MIKNSPFVNNSQIVCNSLDKSYRQVTVDVIDSRQLGRFCVNLNQIKLQTQNSSLKHLLHYFFNNEMTHLLNK